MSRSQLILVVGAAAVLASCVPPASTSSMSAIVIEDEWRRCPPRAPAPPPPGRPRSVEQLAANAWAWRAAWSRTGAARDECASRLAEVIRAIERAAKGPPGGD